jgi:CheY-like chemotaxis protein
MAMRLTAWTSLKSMGTILVIDDEKGISDVIQEALVMFGHHVETARNGNDGIAKFIRKDYDVVITDIRMPQLDGHGVVHYIRNSEKKGTPIIGMSGTPWLLEDKDFDQVLPKPFQLQMLIDTVETLQSRA